jgi:hypothetical protein
MDTAHLETAMVEPGPLKISKLDAGRRQLRTAITLWFNGSDPVATHALAFASYEVLHAVSKKRDPNRMPLIFDSSFIKEEFRSEINIALKKNAYFFKHGDREPEAIIEFNPAMTDGFILFAIAALQLCGESIGTEESAFLLWTRIREPRWSGGDDKALMETILPVDHVHQLKRIPKHDFLHMYKLAQAQRRR